MSSEEIWSIIDDIPGYAISNTGKIVNTRTGKVLSTYLNGYGYERVSLYLNGSRKDYYVHLLVKTAFSGNFIIPPSYRYIVINETRQKFQTVEDCAQFLSTYPSAIYRVLRGERQSHRGYTFSVGVS